jgi:chlorobactene glucosyltransferase
MLYLWLLPWLLLGLVVPFFLRRGPRISDSPPPGRKAAPLVSVIVPARNEAPNLSGCLSSLLHSSYDAREIILVNDHSEDGTGEIAHALAERLGDELRVIDGAPLPDGWSGKAWACWQGYREARGELLLFTDADTRHDPRLLGHAVGALQAKKADLVSVLPRLVLNTMLERLIMPHIWFLLSARHALHALWTRHPSMPQRTLVNGQFLLITREAYEAVGGHESVSGAVMEDIRLAQRLLANKRRVYLAFAENLMEARLFRSVGDAIQGLAKNVAGGVRAGVRPALAAVVKWAVAPFFIVMWVAPPAGLVYNLLAGFGGAFRTWALIATGLSFLFWVAVHLRLRLSGVAALFYPVGAALAAALFLQAAVLGGRVVWKGRVYREGEG